MHHMLCHLVFTTDGGQTHGLPTAPVSACTPPHVSLPLDKAWWPMGNIALGTTYTDLTEVELA